MMENILKTINGIKGANYHFNKFSTLMNYDNRTAC